MSNVYLAYSPNDFFYVDISNNNIELDGTVVNQINPSQEECDIMLKPQWVDKGVGDIENINNNPDISGNSILSWDISCNFWFKDNSHNCIKYQICKNKDSVTNINTLDKKHTSEYAKDLESIEKFKKIFLNTVNLTIGILFLMIILTKMIPMK